MIFQVKLLRNTTSESVTNTLSNGPLNQQSLKDLHHFPFLQWQYVKHRRLKSLETGRNIQFGDKFLKTSYQVYNPTDQRQSKPAQETNSLVFEYLCIMSVFAEAFSEDFIIFKEY